MKSDNGALGYRYGLTRRQFMWLTGIAAAGAAAGCATNPVTGSTQFMTVSEEEEIQIDRQYSPMQFSDDYGPVQDTALNAYVNGIGRGLLGDGNFAKGASVGANRYAISLGMNYLFDESTIFKLEYRYDGSDQPVFEFVRDGSHVKSNHRFGASVVVSF